MSNELGLEIERLRTERELAIARLNSEDRRWTLEHTAEITEGTNRMETVERLIAGPLGGLLSQLGAASVSRLQAQTQPQQAGQQPQSLPQTHGQAQAEAEGAPNAPKPIPPVILVKCVYADCGQEFHVPQGMAMFTCPSCHGELRNPEVVERLRLERETAQKAEAQVTAAPEMSVPDAAKPAEAEVKQEQARQQATGMPGPDKL